MFVLDVSALDQTQIGDTIMAYPWSANDILTAADLNAAIATGIVSTGLGAWTSYTPTWSGTIGNGTIAGGYIKIGRLVRFRVKITWGSTTSHGAGAQTVTIPFTAARAAEWIGGARCVDTSASTGYMRHALTSDTTHAAFAAEAGAFVTGTVPFTWANTDTLDMQGSYESAA